MFTLEELNELFRENWSKILTAGYLVFWKHFPAGGYLDTSKFKIFKFLRNPVEVRLIVFRWLEQSSLLPEIIIMIAYDSFIVFRAFMEYFSEN